MDVSKGFEIANKIFNITEKWITPINKAVDAIDKGIGAAEKASNLSHTKQSNRLDILQKVQEMENNKSNKDLCRRIFKEISDKLQAEHDEYVEMLKAKDLFIEKKKEVNADWKEIIDNLNILKSIYLS